MAMAFLGEPAGDLDYHGNMHALLGIGDEYVRGVLEFVQAR